MLIMWRISIECQEAFRFGDSPTAMAMAMATAMATAMAMAMATAMATARAMATTATRIRSHVSVQRHGLRNDIAPTAARIRRIYHIE
jgi:hypothetical protein